MTIDAVINYAARTDFRQRYYANDHSKDTVVVEGCSMSLVDARACAPDLDKEGFKLVRHASAVSDFTDQAQIAAIHADEIIALLKAETGADVVIVSGPGILRFSEKSDEAGAHNNSMPARFAHIDTSAETSKGFAQRSQPEGAKVRRYAHYNVWRSFSGPPQDVPLAICDAQSVGEDDLLIADALFDEKGKPDWGFESYLIAHNDAHRWHWFSDMAIDEALIFKTSDSEYQNPVPHVAFDHPMVAEDCHPRASLEMRAVAYWCD